MAAAIDERGGSQRSLALFPAWEGLAAREISAGFWSKPFVGEVASCVSTLIPSLFFLCFSKRALVFFSSPSIVILVGCCFFLVWGYRGFQ